MCVCFLSTSIYYHVSKQGAQNVSAQEVRRKQKGHWPGRSQGEIHQECRATGKVLKDGEDIGTIERMGTPETVLFFPAWEVAPHEIF